ncbi:MAG TPA: cupin domain-containing protein [Burkholderiales bacterium]|nr:cupin domain-containing protein [Burkholderiales bacterium]
MGLRSRTDAPISTLADLVAPLSEEAFVAHLRGRTPVVLRGAGAGGRYRSLIDWAGFIDQVMRGEIPAKILRLTKNAIPMPPVFYRDGDVPKSQVIDRVMAGGGSIIVHGVEAYLPGFFRLCADVASQMGERVTAGLIATTGDGGALRLHYDDADLVILQIEGAKRWIVQDHPVIHPVPGMRKYRVDEDANPKLDVVLEPGDLMFLPAGYRHRCENRAERSLHAGIFFLPLTPPGVLELLTREISEDVAHRRPLRFDQADPAATEAALKDELVALIRSLSLTELIARHQASPTSAED